MLIESNSSHASWSCHSLSGCGFLDLTSGAELARQMRQDALITQAMGGLFPEHPDLSQVGRVLDIACGPGEWALEMAFTYPEIEVVGIDPDKHMVAYAHAQAKVQGLHNVSFQVMDIAKPLRFPTNSFDIVNAHMIAPYLSCEEWGCVVKEFMRVVRPGGMLRLTECDEPGRSNSLAYETLKQLYGRAFSRNGQSFHPFPDGPHICITPLLKQFVCEAGGIHARQKVHVLNYSAQERAFLSNYENIKVLYKLGQPFLLKMGVATQEQVDRLYEQMLIDMLSDDFCGLWYFLTVYAEKPASHPPI
ncbi:MAG TPA: class I SAM-dependent methyltransferase [Ktedonosporobacter sp.]|jgi:ubiquinone/menaquinone biosynthesis C-methylase UbiE|nr:class I SAM-dependent methyltransferase [Ktedonosporobacter sp.]